MFSSAGYFENAQTHVSRDDEELTQTRVGEDGEELAQMETETMKSSRRHKQGRSRVKKAQIE